ncbi:MAG: lysoplasmalogenase [Rhodothermales bacterium]
MPLVLSLLVLASTVLLLRAEARGHRQKVYVFKPLATTLILVLALATPSPVSSVYQTFVVLGLLFSLAGDVFLMLPSDRFIAGLASFLVAHLLYIAAFHPAAGSAMSAWALLPFLLYGAVLLRVLWPHLGRLGGPVLLYAAALLVMGWQAAEQHLALHTAETLAALTGAALFVVSDSLLAFNRFVRPFRMAQPAVLSTYFAAQWLIALSVGFASI